MSTQENNNQAAQPDNYFALLHSSYRQLRQSSLVTGAPVVTDENLAEFVKILNGSLPKGNNEALVEQAIKAMYYANPRMFLRMVHSGRRTPNGSRRDVRHFVLLTIGLEIVREFGLEKLIHLTWNQEKTVYEARSLIDPNNPPDVEAFRAEQRANRQNREARHNDRRHEHNDNSDGTGHNRNNRGGRRGPQTNTEGGRRWGDN
jgi:hypothetical protein